ncbi:MAG TPA: hypothetical protein VIV60_20590 [Polyangiaceae bacterium]
MRSSVGHEFKPTASQLGLEFELRAVLLGRVAEWPWILNTAYPFRGVGMLFYSIEGHHESCPTGMVCRGAKPPILLPFRIAVDVDRTIEEEFVVVDVTDIDGERFCFETTTPAEQLPTEGTASIVGRHLATIFRRLRHMGGPRYELVVVNVYAMRAKPTVKVVDVNVGIGYVVPARVDELGIVRRHELPIVEHPHETVQALHVGMLRGVLMRGSRLSHRDIESMVDAARHAHF